MNLGMIPAQYAGEEQKDYISQSSQRHRDLKNNYLFPVFSVNSVREISCALCQFRLFQSRIDPIDIVQIPKMFWSRAAQALAPRVGISDLDIIWGLGFEIWDFSFFFRQAN